MNLISKLLSRRHSQVTTPSPFVSWLGQSGTQYEFMVYPLGTELPPAPGTYIYAKQAENGQWVPLYIAQTRDMHQRLEGHEKLQEAVENGATHILVHFSSTGQAARCTEEHDLVMHYRPVCNAIMEG